jgi:peptidoglycan/LPS O-acetylase OafA/YrhL
MSGYTSPVDSRISPLGPARAVQRTLPYLPGLDGLRAISVLAVVAYHADVRALPGGFLGVEVFFVLSGYLITSLLLAEQTGSGGIDLLAFWRRRARRLLPALAVMLAVVSAGALLFWRDAVEQLRGDLVAAMLYISNWWQILEDRSYFESTGRPPMLQHLWSLAVEEQFYLLFPIVLMFALRKARRTVVGLALVATALLSAWWMAHLFEPYTDPSRVYYGTDTRLSGLLLGSALAFVVVPGAGRRVSPAVARVRDSLGWIGLAGLVWAFVRINEFDPFVYRGGFVLVDVLTLAVIVAIARTESRFGRLLGLGPLEWIGRRSYAIYLWHWPIVVVTRPELDVPIDGLSLLALRIGLTLVLAELSYRFVERPIRTGEMRLLPSRSIMHAAPGRVRYVLPIVLVAAIPVIAVLAGNGGDDSSGELASVVVPQEETAESTTPEERSTETTVSTSVPDPVVDPATTSSTDTTVAPEVAPTDTVPAQPRVLAVGDSVMAGAVPALQAAIPGVTVDATVARQFDGGVDAVRWWTAQAPFDVVVVHLGTNGAFGDEQLDALVAAAGEAEVIFLEASAPRPWIPLANERIHNGAARHDATVVSWRPAVDAVGGPGSDGIHLGPSASTAYANEVAAAISAATG